MSDYMMADEAYDVRGFADDDGGIDGHLMSAYDEANGDDVGWEP